MERTLSVLQRMSSYFHDDVREQAYDSLAYLVAATAKAFPAPAPGVRSHSMHASRQCVPHPSAPQCHYIICQHDLSVLGGFLI